MEQPTYHTTSNISTIVFSVLLYGSNTLKLKATVTRNLQFSIISCLRPTTMLIKNYNKWKTWSIYEPGIWPLDENEKCAGWITVKLITPRWSVVGRP